MFTNMIVQYIFILNRSCFIMKKTKDMKDECCCGDSCSTSYKSNGCMFYGLGFVGAAVYNISVASGFWGIVVALLKAAVWPAFLVYKLYSYLGA